MVFVDGQLPQAPVAIRAGYTSVYIEGFVLNDIVTEYEGRHR